MTLPTDKHQNKRNQVMKSIAKAREKKNNNGRKLVLIFSE
jgi:hypothetical protein